MSAIERKNFSLIFREEASVRRKEDSTRHSRPINKAMQINPVTKKKQNKETFKSTFNKQ